MINTTRAIAQGAIAQVAEKESFAQHKAALDQQMDSVKAKFRQREAEIQKQYDVNAAFTVLHKYVSLTWKVWHVNDRLYHCLLGKPFDHAAERWTWNINPHHRAHRSKTENRASHRRRWGREEYSRQTWTRSSTSTEQIAGTGRDSSKFGYRCTLSSTSVALFTSKSMLLSTTYQNANRLQCRRNVLWTISMKQKSRLKEQTNSLKKCGKR